jgi:hypothetical protein
MDIVVMKKNEKHEKILFYGMELLECFEMILERLTTTMYTFVFLRKILVAKHERFACTKEAKTGQKSCTLCISPLLLDFVDPDCLY